MTEIVRGLLFSCKTYLGSMNMFVLVWHGKCIIIDKKKPQAFCLSDIFISVKRTVL